VSILAPPAGREAEPPRAVASAPLVSRILLFLPDRMLDFLDVASFGLGIGYGFAVHQQITCSLHVPTLGSYQTINLLNWYPSRNLCVCTRSETEAGLLPFVLYRSEFLGAGTGWDSGRPGSGLKSYAEVGLGSPSDPIHQEGFRDPWAIGAQVGPLMVSPRVELEIHPMEIVDFVVGTLTFGILDLTRDDWLTAAFTDDDPHLTGSAPGP
jgi:hypothetical protein